MNWRTVEGQSPRKTSLISAYTPRVYYLENCTIQWLILLLLIRSETCSQFLLASPPHRCVKVSFFALISYVIRKFALSATALMIRLIIIMQAVFTSEHLSDQKFYMYTHHTKCVHKIVCQVLFQIIILKYI